MDSATPFFVYRFAEDGLTSGGLWWTGHRFGLALFQRESNCGDLVANRYLGDLTHEVPERYGYTQGGVTLGTDVHSSGTKQHIVERLMADPTAWLADGGDITARWFVIYFKTVPDNPLLCVSMFNRDVTAVDGRWLNFTPNPHGLITLRRSVATDEP